VSGREETERFLRGGCDLHDRVAEMSRIVLNRILRALHMSLSQSERDELLHVLTRYLGVEGAYECDALEQLWKDEYYRKAIEEFIRRWVRRRRAARWDVEGEEKVEVTYVT